MAGLVAQPTQYALAAEVAELRLSAVKALVALCAEAVLPAAE